MSEPAISASGEYLYQRVLPLFNEDETYGWFGRYLVDALMSMMQGLDQVILDSPTNPGWTQLADPVNCPEVWLPWCAQLLGVVLPPELTATEQRTYIIAHPAQDRGTPAALLTFLREKATEVRLIEREGPNGEAKAYWFLVVIAANHFAEAINVTGNVKSGENKIKSVTTAGIKVGAEVFAAGFVAGTTVTKVGATELVCSSTSTVTATGEEVTVLNPAVTLNFTNYVNSIKAAGLKWTIIVRSYKQVEAKFATYALLEAAYATYSNLETGP
jgi:P2-related tail formation protein